MLQLSDSGRVTSPIDKYGNPASSGSGIPVVTVPYRIAKKTVPESSGVVVKNAGFCVKMKTEALETEILGACNKSQTNVTSPQSESSPILESPPV
jgi:hypothetical protein